MRFGVNTFLFTPSFGTGDLDLLGTIRGIGYDCVEIGLPDPERLDLAAARSAFEEQGLACCSVCCAFGAGRDLRGTLEEQQNAKRYIIDALQVCSGLKAPVLAGPFYSRTGRAEYVPDAARKEQFELVVRGLRELCSVAEDQGVRLAVEVMNRFATDFLNTARDALRLVEAVGSPMIGLHLDTFHMNIEEADIPAAIIEAGDRLFHLHVADNHRGAPGSGTLDWTGIRDALRRIRYTGPVVVETFMPATNMRGSVASVWRALAESPEDMASQSLRFLNALFGS